MCTRIVNNKMGEVSVTGRNMDWYWPLNSYLYFLSKEGVRFGINSTTYEVQCPDDLIHTWKADFSSIATVFGDENVGYTTVDGMNEQGLVVNALYDSETKYCSVADVINVRNQAKHPEDIKLIGMSRWAQFILDSFDSVEATVAFLNIGNLFVVNEKVPDSSNMEGSLHLSLSDKYGESAVIEVREGKYNIYSNPKNNVVTNQPSYEKQLTLRAYWEFLWGTDTLKPDEKLKPAAFRLVPGGNSSHERFERASYYYTFSKPCTKAEDVLPQTRSMVATCAVPMLFDAKMPDDGRASFTIWTNLAESNANKYHYIDTFTMNDAWLSFEDLSEEKESMRIAMVSVENQQTKHFPNNHGNLFERLSLTNNPYLLG